jgi:hypothetical protein
MWLSAPWRGAGFSGQFRAFDGLATAERFFFVSSEGMCVRGMTFNGTEQASD